MNLADLDSLPPHMKAIRTAEELEGIATSFPPGRYRTEILSCAQQLRDIASDALEQDDDYWQRLEMERRVERIATRGAA